MGKKEIFKIFIVVLIAAVELFVVNILGLLILNEFFDSGFGDFLKVCLWYLSIILGLLSIYFNVGMIRGKLHGDFPFIYSFIIIKVLWNKFISRFHQ